MPGAHCRKHAIHACAPLLHNRQHYCSRLVPIPNAHATARAADARGRCAPPPSRSRLSRGAGRPSRGEACERGEARARGGGHQRGAAARGGRREGTGALGEARESHAPPPPSPPVRSCADVTYMVLVQHGNASKDARCVAFACTCVCVCVRVIARARARGRARGRVRAHCACERTTVRGARHARARSPHAYVGAGAPPKLPMARTRASSAARLPSRCSASRAARKPPP